MTTQIKIQENSIALYCRGKKMYKIGIIGCGFVGKAVAAGFSLHVESVKMYDRYIEGYDSFDDTAKLSDYLFICIPTPTRKDGTQDLTELLEVINQIDRCSPESKIIVIKSTVLPGTTRGFSKKWPRHMFVFNPEFLSARIARLDFINPSRIILGGEWNWGVRYVADLYHHRFGEKAPIFCVDWETAELVKYVANAFFATKIAFCNTMYEVAKKLDVDYSEVKDLWLLDGKVANSHCDVPGHDGKFGYGGKCFPKDLRAFMHFIQSDLGLDCDILESTRIWERTSG